MTNSENSVGGAVNFDSNLVPASEQAAAQRIDAHPMTEGISFGTKLHEEPAGEDEVVVQAVAEVVPQHQQFIEVALDLTLNTGLDFLKGLKGLKTVEIVNNKTGATDSYNFYHPFLRAAKSRNTCDGLLRALASRIAAIVSDVHGYKLKDFAGREECIPEMRGVVQQYVNKLIELFPVPAEADLFSIDLTTADGQVYPRVVRFNEMFNVSGWYNTYNDAETGSVTHQITFNISMNLGALYDSAERDKFVIRAFSFLESLLKANGMYDVVPHHVNYAFAAESLGDELVAEAFAGLRNPEKGEPYELVSLSAVQNGLHPWAPRDASKLFGYGCDLILRSPDPMVEDDEAVDAE